MDFASEKKIITDGVETSERVYEASNILKGFNQFFIHPYIQGFWINSIIERYNKNNLTEEFIENVFVSEFYNLTSTVSFIDGIFCNCKYIKPFNFYIESSLILCFQKDYAGAINLILPTIEAILAKYLSEEKEIDVAAKNRYEKIKKAIGHIIEDMMQNCKSALSRSATLNFQQQQRLLDLNRKYIDNWYSIMDDFLQTTLYLHTNSLSPDISLNRHAILHLLNPTNYHTLNNYIKLFNTIKFFAWILLQLEGKSVLSTISNEDFLTKTLQYETLIRKSDSLQLHKHILLKSYQEYNLKEIRREVKPRSISPDNIRMKLILKLWISRDNLRGKIELGRVFRFLKKIVR